MKISLDSLKRFYLFLAVFYYVGFLNFFSRLVGVGRSGADNYSANISGSMSRQFVGVLLILLGIFILLKINRRLLVATLRQSIWWWLLVAYFFCSIYWSYEPSISLRRVIAFSTLLLATFCVVQLFDVRSLLLYIAKAVFLAALLGLIYAVIDPANGLSSEGTRSNALLGIFGDKNGGARVYAYGILLLVGLGRYHRGSDRIMIGVLAFCILIAESATAIVMLSVGISLIVMFNYFRTHRAQLNLTRFLLICLLLVLASLAVSYLYEFILTLLGRDPSLTNRVVIWELMDAYIAQEPWFGYGFGAYWSSDAVQSFMERWGFIGNAHSGYYEALLHGGRFCLLLLIMVLLFTVKDLVIGYIKHLDGKIFSALIPIVILQIVVNYVAFILINHNSFDMFLFAVISFVAAIEQAKLSLGDYQPTLSRVNQPND